MDQIRVDQQNLPKKERYGIGELLKTIDLKRPTYYDERKRIINKNDKYADVKVVIKEIAEKGKWRGSYTYGCHFLRKLDITWLKLLYVA
ncbi:hypothetical protein IGB11_00065 [Ligilactobacillus salivarius]|uniref:hypothetical protein n=1 Tax=Ligilactobacillus salivarius TaxID=1624 RepID=UPI0017800442|nr:hypothetical protein [Ligilactobacillus salivarius]QXL49466.1 hypothetical protein IGB11_00065 [Ligilactobacillus salivarius]